MECIFVDSKVKAELLKVKQINQQTNERRKKARGILQDI